MRFNMMKKSIYVLALSTLFLACGSEDETPKSQTESVETSAKEDSGKMIKDPNATPNVSINGTVNNGGNATLLLEANTDRGPILISKTERMRMGASSWMVQLK